MDRERLREAVDSAAGLAKIAKGTLVALGVPHEPSRVQLEHWISLHTQVSLAQSFAVVAEVLLGAVHDGGQESAIKTYDTTGETSG